jgi:hypothetical protein
MKAIEQIKWLQDVFVIRKEEQHFEVNILIKNAFTETIAELQDLESYVEERVLEYKKYSGYTEREVGYFDGQENAYTDILQRIRGEK